MIEDFLKTAVYKGAKCWKKIKKGDSTKKSTQKAAKVFYNWFKLSFVMFWSLSIPSTEILDK